MLTDAALAIEIARFQLLRGRVAKVGPPQPEWVFLAHLLQGLKEVESPGLETMATDGVSLLYDPVTTLSWNELERIAVLAHEALHNALDHPAQFGHEADDEAVQLGCDAPINWGLHEMGLILPGHPIIPGIGKFRWLAPRLTTPEYIELLRQKKRDEPPQPGPGQAKPGQDPAGAPGGGDGEGEADGEAPPAPGSEGGPQHGQFKPMPTDAPTSTVRRNWQVRVIRAEAAARAAAVRATGRGDLPGWLEELVAEVKRTKICWEEVLREWMRQRMPAPVSDWSRFSRRWLGQGHYLAVKRTRRPGVVGMTVDRSGSMDPEAVARCVSQVMAIGELEPTELHVYVHDRWVVEEFHWQSGDPDLVLPTTLKGGGGTSHVPVFERLLLDTPDIIIACTDLDTCFPDTPPDAPVLWVSTQLHHRTPPWGDTLLAVD